MDVKGILQQQRAILERLYGGRVETELMRRYRLALHLSFGNGTETTARECEALSEAERRALLNEFDRGEL